MLPSRPHASARARRTLCTCLYGPPTPFIMQKPRQAFPSSALDTTSSHSAPSCVATGMWQQRQGWPTSHTSSDVQAARPTTVCPVQPAAAGPQLIRFRLEWASVGECADAARLTTALMRPPFRARSLWSHDIPSTASRTGWVLPRSYVRSRRSVPPDPVRRQGVPASIASRRCSPCAPHGRLTPPRHPL